MSEMVERVARAMAIVDKGDDMWEVMSEDGDGYGYVGKNEYRVMARAAIEAMREPTAPMLEQASEFDLDKACSNDRGCTHQLWSEEATKIWQKQIDEALR